MLTNEVLSHMDTHAPGDNLCVTATCLYLDTGLSRSEGSAFPLTGDVHPDPRAPGTPRKG